jgi:hypothetical protein
MCPIAVQTGGSIGLVHCPTKYLYFFDLIQVHLADACIQSERQPFIHTFTVAAAIQGASQLAWSCQGFGVLLMETLTLGGPPTPTPN